MERPILFSGPMVRAILEGRKTQTRRVIKKPKRSTMSDDMFFSGIELAFRNGLEFANCPYGKPGDSLWVRETFFPFGDAGALWYRAGIPEYHCARLTGEWLDFPYKLDGEFDPPQNLKWRPSIFMPRWASRITLRVVNVRVERLQDISEADAIAEGIKQDANGLWLPGGYDNAPIWAYSDLWDNINSETHPWNSNPWVWVLEFEKGQ